MTRALTRWLWAAIALVVIVLPLLPLGRWSGAPDAGPAWGPNLTAWGLGLLVVLTVALVVGRAVTWLPHLTSPRYRPVPDAAITSLLAVGFTAAAAWVMRSVFASNPHLVDETAQLFHARIFANGALAAPAPVAPEAFLFLHTWVTDAGWISQYPPGQTVLLAVGLVLHAEWLVNPLLGGAGVFLVYFLARGLFGRRTAKVSALLWACSAWVLFTSASYLNHVGAITFALAAWALVWGPRRPRAIHLIGAGAALACVAATRPLDGIAVAVPILVWAFLGRWRTVPWLIAGGLPVAVVWGWVNWRLHGGALTLGYSVLYGEQHALGFHIDPWGYAFTPAVALSNLGVAIRRLHIYLFEWPIPALLPLVLWAALGRHRSERDLLVALGLASLPVLYFFYWHSGFFRGPRFYYGMTPWLVIGTARSWNWLWALAGRVPDRIVRWRPALGAAAGMVLVWGWVGLVPSRIEQYRTELPTLKLHPERQLGDRDAEEALVLVTTSWGSRIVADLWALGVTPGLAERAYRWLDACDLDRLRRRVRTDRLSTEDLSAELERMIQSRPSAAPPVQHWPDPTLRLERRTTMPAHCRVEMERDLRGFTTFGNLAWRNAIGLDRGPVFARDLFERNDVLRSHYQGWQVWRYAPAEGDPDGLPVLVRLEAVGTDES